MARGKLPGEDWEFFAAFNAVTEAHDLLKKKVDKGQVDSVEIFDLATRLLRITDRAQTELSGQLDRSSVAHARARIALHHVLTWSDANTFDDHWESAIGNRVCRLLRVASQLLEQP